MQNEDARAPSGSLDNHLIFDNVSVEFGARRAIEDVSIRIRRGEFVSVIGPSGCGKSTLLNLASGLLEPSDGQVLIDGKRVDGINVGASYVTQDSNLLPWLRVFGNIALPLRLRGESNETINSRVREAIAYSGLEGFENYFPRELSGGMSKRCAIARALVSRPDLTLMDEPFGPLDALTRMKLQQELMNIVQETKPTVIFVTHDLIEAISLADTVIVMSTMPGKVLTRIDVGFDRPRNLATITESAEFQKLHQQLRGYFDLGPEAGTH